MPEMESVETVAAASRGAKLTKLTIQRNTCGPDDVTIDIKYDNHNKVGKYLYCHEVK